MKISSKLGKYTGKFCGFMKRKETRAAWLTAEWAVSTVAFATTAYALLLIGSPLLALLFAAIYTYGSYALFSIMLPNS
jgi:hypothetical protein